MQQNTATDSVKGNFPETRALRKGLTEVIGGPVVLLSRQPNPYGSSFPSEIITCRVDGEGTHKLLVKYDADSEHTGHGYWGGVAYEAVVYRDLLQTLGGSMPRFYGTYIGSAGRTWLVLEYLNESLRVNKVPGRMPRAARWLGAFHARGADHLRNASCEASPVRHLNTYDASYYQGWARRTAQYAASLNDKYPWLPTLCTRAQALLPILAEGTPTFIHGEYYPHNILVRGGTIYPVDWQSAAVARGAVDLASLTEGWDAATTGACERAYCQARWSGEPPAGFERTLRAARLYWPLRWLGDRPAWTLHPRRQGYFEVLRAAGERAGLL